MTVEDCIELFEQQYRLPATAVKQILIVKAVIPRQGEWQDSGPLAQGPIDGADVLLTGVPSPSSDKDLKQAVIRFTDGKLSPPTYVEERHEIRFDKHLSSLGPFLQAMAGAKAIYCWIGFYPGQTYADVHCMMWQQAAD